VVYTIVSSAGARGAVPPLLRGELGHATLFPMCRCCFRELEATENSPDFEGRRCPGPPAPLGPLMVASATAAVVPTFFPLQAFISRKRTSRERFKGEAGLVIARKYGFWTLNDCPYPPRARRRKPFRRRCASDKRRVFFGRFFPLSVPL